MPAAAPVIAAAVVGTGVSAGLAGPVAAGTIAPLYASLTTVSATAVTAYAASRVVGLNDRSSSVDDLYGGVRINPGKADEPIPVPYGLLRVGGPFAYRATQSGTNNRDLWVVVVWGEGEIGGIDEHWFDSQKLSEMDSDDKENIKYVGDHFGDDLQSVDTKMRDAVADWTTAHRLQGIAYTVYELKYDINTFKTGLPVFSADVRGIKCFDPRTGVKAWTDNPALILLDYLTNTRYGRGVPYSKIDEPSFVAAADYCEEMVVYPSGKQYQRYTCNIVLDTSRTIRENALAIAATMRGLPIYSGGIWSLIIDRPETYHPTRLTDDIMIGDWRTDLGNKADRPNRILATYLDKNRKYEPYQVLVSSGLMLAEDNGVVNEMRVSLPGTVTRRAARRIAGEELKQARQSKRVAGRCNLRALEFATGDVVQVDSVLNGWDGKPFRIQRPELHGDDTILIEAIEYDTSVYTLDVNDEDDIPDTDLADPFKTTRPRNLQLAAATDELLVSSSGTLHSRILATWEYSTSEPASVLYTEVRWKDSNSLFWTTATTDDLSLYLQPVVDGLQYDVQARSANIIGKHSRWTSVERILVEGKTAPPRKPTGFRVSIEPDGRKSYSWNDTEKDPDWQGWRIYYSATATFSSAARLHEGLLTDSPYLADLPYQGVWYFWLVQVDTSQIESDPREIGPVDLTGVQIGNAIYNSDARALGWPGNLNNCVRSSGQLVPFDNGVWDDLGATTWQNWTTYPFVAPVASFIYQHTAVDLGASMTVTPIAFGEGSDDLDFEVRDSSDGAAWSAWAAVGTETTNRHFQFRVTAAKISSKVAHVNSALFMLVI